MTERNTREIVVVTGASAGVGRAIVREFARRGADVGLLARGVDGLEGARAEVERAGGRAVVVPCDVADPDQVEAAAERVERELGPIDVWVNDAMVTVLSAFIDMTPQEFRRVTEVTYLGTVNGTLAALKRMKPRNRGTIVQVGSALAYRGIPLQTAYCGAKHAIRGFTDSLRTELLHDRSDVHVTMVQLPAVNTPQFSWCRTRLDKHPQPVPPIYQPEVPASAVWYAAHSRRREVWVGTTAVKVIIGNKLAPGLADRYLAKTGFSSQQMQDRPVDPTTRRDNLFEPVPGDHGAHGIFDERSRDSSPQLWATRHRGWFYGAAGLALAVAATAAIK